MSTCSKIGTYQRTLETPLRMLEQVLSTWNEGKEEVSKVREWLLSMHMQQLSKLLGRYSKVFQ